MKIAIIGAGFCGLAIAWNLLQYPCSSHLKIEIFDSKGIGGGTSGIAAGLLHPFAGAHAKLNWRGPEGCQATKELIDISSQALGRSVTANDRGILRLALNDEQLADFQLCAEKHPYNTAWLDADACTQFAPGCISAPGLWIKSGITVFSPLYLQGLWLACSKRGVKYTQHRASSLQEFSNYDMTIAAAGAETLGLPELSGLSLNQVKGQVLELSWPKNIPPLTCALNSQVYLLMTETKTSCLVGATYEKGQSSAEIDLQIAKKELLPKAFELFPALSDSLILNCYAGMRAVAAQHRPILISISPSQWVLTGMGSKGLLYHALYARELAQKLLETYQS